MTDANIKVKKKGWIKTFAKEFNKKSVTLDVTFWMSPALGMRTGVGKFRQDTKLGNP